MQGGGVAIHTSTRVGSETVKLQHHGGEAKCEVSEELSGARRDGKTRAGGGGWQMGKGCESRGAGSTTVEKTETRQVDDGFGERGARERDEV